MKLYNLNTFVCFEKFKHHKDYKNKILLEIEKNNNTLNSSYGREDSIKKCDWEESDNFEREYIKLIIKDLYTCIATCGNNFNLTELVINKIWFQQYFKNDVHNWHVHGDCQFTGVYYVELPQNAPKTQILEPINNKITTLNVEEGDIIFFPSFIIHTAPKILENSRKTIISFNFNFDDINTFSLFY